MKIRPGFVSNSSSSNFVLIGFEVDSPKEALIERLWGSDPEIAKILELRNQPKQKRGCTHPEMGSNYCAICGKKMWTPVDVEAQIESQLRALFYDYDGKEGISIKGSDYTDGCVIVGVQPVSTWEYEFRSEEIDLDALSKKLESIRKRLNLKTNPKVFAGTYAC
jgi:hypothetical protein